MVDKTDDKYAKLQRALKHVNRIQNSVDKTKKKSGLNRIATDNRGNAVYTKKVEEMKKKDKAPSSSKQNPVAKHMRTFNKATVQRDRKKDAKRGYKKHSNAYENMQIDELSDDGLHSYISKSMKASDQAHDRKYAAHNSANNAKTDSSAARLRKVSKGHAAIQKKRDAGIQQALKKVTGRAKVNATESVEQTDEGIISTGIAKVKAGHYDRKAKKSFSKASNSLGYGKGKSIAQGTSDEEGFSNHMKKGREYESKAKKIRSDAFRKTKKFASYSGNGDVRPPRVTASFTAVETRVGLPTRIPRWSKPTRSGFLAFWAIKTSG